MRALTALRQHPMRYGFCIGRPAGARVGGLGPRPLTQRALPSTQLQARGRTTSGRAPVPEFSRRRAVAMATGPHAGPQRLPAQRGVIGSTSSKSLRNAVVVTSTAADASGPTDDASPSQADGAQLLLKLDMVTPADKRGLFPFPKRPLRISAPKCFVGQLWLT